MSMSIPPAALALAALLVAHTATSQNHWTPEQQAVWKTETTIANELVEGSVPWQYFDADCVAWPQASPVPVPRRSLQRWTTFRRAAGNKPVFIDLIPLVIWVKGDCAFADYHERAVSENKNGKRELRNTHRMDVLIKRDGKWIVAGWAGGSDPGAKTKTAAAGVSSPNTTYGPASPVPPNGNTSSNAAYTTFINGVLAAGMGL